ncbi:unnamed protein product [Triticum turgidum subsp. durum]|uniref:Uncharacterized protein n=1 Tax=Triticum turgidum subsp. durum TaxID=4567 RepID=A0A9R1PBJ4_TRITD|nr:unnamed protein product [Triticum turgidum subsp. durum]
MDLATGAMGSLLPKLVELLKDEYKLKESVKEGVKSLEKEMKSMQAALRKVAEVPHDQLEEQVKLWAGEVRELSFDMEDTIDKFLVRVDEESESSTKSNKLKQLMKKMAGLFTKGKARHEIADAIKDINKQVQEVADRRARYNVDNIVARPEVVTLDPRLRALYMEVTDLVGISGKRDQELMNLLSGGDDMSKTTLKIVSVVGFGGLGKTTLVKTVYDKIKEDFHCRAFVSVGRNGTAKKVLVDILLALKIYESHFTIFNETQLIDEVRERLKNKRYLIVIDDIWDEKLWTVINWAFSKGNNFGSRLITTTRIVSVSKLCCSSANDEVYQMEPLSDDDSKMLFHKRIFSQESGCPREFEEVSRDILKKCGGVPLAIITIASILASDKKINSLDEWKVLLESIGRGLTKDHSVEEMLRILSFSYYDLPSHLRTCLLYLSMFPEDHKIMKAQLIWMWIAERFIQCEDAQSSLYEIGENYFNELVNRSLIQPVYSSDDGLANACRVHDSVLDLICSLSVEEKFVTIVNGSCDTMSCQGIIRRLSIQNVRKEEDQTRPLRPESIAQVRSIATFASPAMDLLPSLSNFAVLRVLHLDGYIGSLGYHLNPGELGSLLHLRYLHLCGTGFDKLLGEIGKLQFLQVLDLPEHTRLPSTVIKLTRLMYLRIGRGSWNYDPPDGIGNLTSLEVLGRISVSSVSIVKELGNMVKLRELKILFDDLWLDLEEAFVESLGKMPKIQRVEIVAGDEDSSTPSMNLLGERWVPPGCLQEFAMFDDALFDTLPTWIRRNPSHLSQLFKLDISLYEVRQEDLDNLGRLPALGVLELSCSYARKRMLHIGGDGFRCLTSFYLYFGVDGNIVFQPGAMPKAEHVDVTAHWAVVKEEASGNNGADWFDPGIGMGNLPSLRKVKVRVDSHKMTVGEAKQAKAALENALRAHPNLPLFCVEFRWSIKEGAHDDDLC